MVNDPRSLLAKSLSTKMWIKQQIGFITIMLKILLKRKIKIYCQRLR